MFASPNQSRLYEARAEPNIRTSKASSHLQRSGLHKDRNHIDRIPASFNALEQCLSLALFGVEFMLIRDKSNN